MMTGFTYSSPVHEFIEGVVRKKRAMGYKYDSCARTLYKFDRFCLEYGCTEPVLSKELVTAWSQKHPNEAQSTLRNRVGVVRQLAVYVNRLGANAYILPKNTIPKGPRYVPHIFSNKELAAFFRQTDACHVQSLAPHRHWIMPLLFRMLYGCGLRVSEALNLRLQDVDLQSGVLTILDGKLNKDRLVPLSAELVARCEAYMKRVHLFSDEITYFFPAPNGQAVTRGNVYKNFRKFLWKARISHGSWGKGPRVHDFRHTFAVHCLRRWVLEGKDLAAYLPVLKTYLGHHSFRDTSQYLRLTAELYPDITAKVSDAFGHVIPMLDGTGHDAD
ncbi:tyrosine-type recombinase/integrase [Alicyclobacillus dauci]|uniref:Tyrosine-type recombinase/integrase n=1 Tax=Alicyclobacillus dauci TaxID=1475485 RepID=A0ABY6Z7Y8_9BACL|nr:tyrosine-type recombinase/integrase [Alicyclobacillus dauci]WAH38845.1 tyrosine-type recombinase/integrase [Alicyclobacillus dauci]